MATLNSILSELKKKGTAQTQQTYARHGMATEHTFGTNSADMKKLAKTIKGQQAWACELYESGKMEAMYVAALVANGAQLTEKQLDQWADAASRRELALKWMGSNKELVACSGWSTYSYLASTKPNEELDLKEIEKLLAAAEHRIHQAPNRVRSSMNSFVIAVCSHVQPLSARAIAAAKKIGVVNVDKSDTKCKVPSAVAYIEKAAAKGCIGEKRKSARC